MPAIAGFQRRELRLMKCFRGQARSYNAQAMRKAVCLMEHRLFVGMSLAALRGYGTGIDFIRPQSTVQTDRLWNPINCRSALARDGGVSAPVIAPDEMLSRASALLQ